MKTKVTTIKSNNEIIFWFSCEICGTNKRVDSYEVLDGHGEGICDKDNIAKGKQQKLMEVNCDI